MRQTSLKVGECYELEFTPSVAGIVIPSIDPHISSKFGSTYAGFRWGDFAGKQVIILADYRYKERFIHLCRFHLKDDPSHCWAIIHRDFFRKPQKCQCNLWKTGCICGAFNKEHTND